ncbi:MAG: glycosyltransferase, partial [Marinobacter sp.]|nr:glycosyltransferase [Marinobacter sp.]
KPRELRLMHFAFWFFVLISTLAWALRGFHYDDFKILGTHARLLLFWPLLVALLYSGLRATGVFLATGALALGAVVAVSLDWYQGGGSLASYLQHRVGAGINPIMFGNLALLAGVLALIGGLYFARNRRYAPAAITTVVGLAALVLAVASQTRSNFIALPCLLFIMMFLLKPRWRIPSALAMILVITGLMLASDRLQGTLTDLMAGSPGQSIRIRLELWHLAWQIFLAHPLAGAGLTGFSDAVSVAVGNGALTPDVLACCSGHAHNDLLTMMATRGLPGLLSGVFLIIVPLVLFARHINNRHVPTAHLAVAGTIVSTAFLIFGLTEATFHRSLFLTTYLMLIATFAAALFTELNASCYRQRRVTVSATVITKNEAHHIADCLQSVRAVADEIIVLDSGSSDDTVAIARQYADIVEETDWPGFGVQKQRALERATGDWVLSIDADERITPDLAREINHHLADPDADAYKLPWAVTLCGTRLDFGRSGRAPLRLFRREGVRFSDALVHEKILIPEGRTVKTLRGRLTHYTHRDFGHALEKSAKYAWLGSQEKYRKGKTTRTLLYPTFRGLMTFIQVYFIRFGFLDGPVGFLVAVTYSQGSFNKYAGLWTLRRTEKRKARE